MFIAGGCATVSPTAQGSSVPVGMSGTCSCGSWWRVARSGIRPLEGGRTEWVIYQ
jgi:hypothetical protein